jgi:Flp pilus assembly protein TadD
MAMWRDPEQAVKVAKEAVHLAPNSGGCWNTLGVAYYRAGDWKAALTALDRSLELRPGDAFDFLFLGIVHPKLGHRNEAHMHKK